MPTKHEAVLLENIQARAETILREAGVAVTSYTSTFEESRLEKCLKTASIVGIRSATHMTESTFTQAQNLLAIGAFCIGTNQIDLAAASQKGIAVFNAPYSNTRSVVELTMAEIMMLSRRIAEHTANMHAGIWEKSAKGSHEVRGKTLGIVGYGNIGSQLSVLAESVGMHVCFYDIADKLVLGNAERCKTLAELLKKSDVVTLHVDGRPSNTDLIGKKELAMMKNGSYLINNSRGHVADIEALGAALKSGKLAGAACDVHPLEPDNGAPFVSPLRSVPNVILTPHIGGSTAEAQQNIAEFVARKLQRYMETGDTMLSVNLPQLRVPPVTDGIHRLAYVHQNVPGVLAKLNGILTSSNINIVGQYLATSGSIGYVVVDAEKPYTNNDQNVINSLPETIKLRILS